MHVEAEHAVVDADAPEALDVQPAVLSWGDLLRSPKLQAMLAQARVQADDLDWQRVTGFVLDTADVGVAFVGGVLSFTSYLLLAAVIIAFCFYFFSIHFDGILGFFVPLIPIAHRERTLAILREMDRTIASFIRGRLLQAGVMMSVLTIGWWVTGVPYFLLLAVLSGLLNLLPYAAVVGWAAAVLLTVLDHLGGGSPGTSWWWIVIAPSVVYAVAQLLDGWLVEPVVQGKAVNLDPASVLIAVLLGASLAGLLGMILAIPTAACIKILSREVVLPKLRRLAAGEPPI